MDFYNTRGGRMFVDSTIPRLVRAVENLTKAVSTKKVQYTRAADPAANIAKLLEKEFADGAIYVDKIEHGGKIVFVFEKEVQE